MVKNLEIRLCIRSAYGTKKGLPVKSRKPLIFLVELRRFERPTPSVRAKWILKKASIYQTLTESHLSSIL